MLLVQQYQRKVACFRLWLETGSNSRQKTGEIEWSHPLNKGEDCNDVEITREGNILYAYTSGARMITRDQQTVWDFKAKKGEELFTATQLPSGHYMLAICGTPSRIIELDPQGHPVEEIKFDTSITGVHDQFRQIVKTPQNTYLIPLMGKGEVVEMTKRKGNYQQGRMRWQPLRHPDTEKRKLAGILRRCA